MKLYYTVVEMFHINGKTIKTILPKKIKSDGKHQYHHTPVIDYYIDFFTTKAKAERFALNIK